jgi:hypothetical protein
MTRTSLAERQARLEQQRARLQLEENRVREAERKARTRRLIEAGGLVDKASLLELDPNALYGALLGLATRLGDAAEVARWQAEGGRAFEREARARDVEKEPLILSLDGVQPATVTARLRALGFRWSKVLRHWEGLASFDAARRAADELGGTLRRVTADAAPAPAGGTGGSGDVARAAE